MAKLSDLLNKPQDNGWISMAELDALEAAQRGQPVGQIPGSFGPGQGSFQRSGGNLVNLTPQGWQDTQTNEMMAPASQRPNQDVQLDYANPIDYMGAKGFRLKADSNRVLLNDGRMVSLSPQADAAKAALRQKQEAAQLDMDLKRQQLENLRTKAAPGSAKDPQWKYDSGSDTWVAPPSAENPEGKVTVPASRANAAKSLAYVAEQFAPVIEKTPQGGFMGVSGLLGKVTNSQEARRFDNLREQLSTELRTVFRIPGEGSLSDREQAQYGVQLPDVRNDAETNKQILRDIQARAGMRIGGGQAQPAAQPPAQLMQEAEQAIARGAPRDAVMQRLQERLRGQ